MPLAGLLSPRRIRLPGRCFATHLAAILALTCAGESRAGAPQRVVSLNLCADELVLALADRSQISSVTWLVKDPGVSWSAHSARGIPHNYGTAAEIIGLNPDLVVAGAYTTRSAVDMLRRLGVPVLTLALPVTIEGVEEQVAEVARALGHPARGRAMIADMEARLARLGPAPDGHRPVAAVYQPNGFTVGPDSMIHTVLRRAGLRNLALEMGRNGSGTLPLEILIMERPDVLIMNSSTQGLPSLAHEILEHPALEGAFAEPEVLAVPVQSWNCGTPYVVEAIERLRQGVRQWQAGRQWQAWTPG